MVLWYSFYSGVQVGGTVQVTGVLLYIKLLWTSDGSLILDQCVMGEELESAD